jgi:hypothetical protein
VAQEYTAHRRAQRAFEHILSEVMREDLEGVRYDPAARLEDRERTAVVPQYVWRVRPTPRSPLRHALVLQTRLGPDASLKAHRSAAQGARLVLLVPDVLKRGQQSGLVDQ